MKTLAKKGFTINTIYDALGVSVSLVLNQGMTAAQEFINDYSEYIPDYALSPLVITPKAFVTDPSGKTPHLPTDNVILASQTTNIKWYIVKDTGNELISSTVGGDYTISTTGDTKGQLTVRKNLNVNSGRTFLFTCDFKDERTGMFQAISKTISLTCTAATLTMLKSRLFTPLGNTFNYKTPSLSVHQKVYNGGEEMPDVARWWYKDGVQITPANANGITGYYSDTLVVPDSVVGDSETEIKVVADRVEDANFLYGVKDGISYQVSGGQPINTLIPNILTVDRIKSATNFNMSFKLNASNVVVQNQDDAQWYLGPELITNGGFDTDSVWSKNGVNISGGYLNFSSAPEGSYAYQKVLSPYKAYVIKFEIIEISGKVTAFCGLSQGSSSNQHFDTIGQKTIIITNSGATNGNIAIGSVFNLTTAIVDNVSVKEVLYHNPNRVSDPFFELGDSGFNPADASASSIAWDSSNKILRSTSIKGGGIAYIEKMGYSMKIVKFKARSVGMTSVPGSYVDAGKTIVYKKMPALSTSWQDYEYWTNSANVFTLGLSGIGSYIEYDYFSIRDVVEPRLFFNIPLKDKSGNAIDLQVERKFAYESNTASIVNENVNAIITLPQSGAPYTLNGNGVGGVQGIASGSLNVSELQLTQTNAQVPYKPAVLDGYLPATQSDRALTDKVLLKYKIEGIDYTIECPSAVNPDVKMLNPKVVLTNNQGVITNPEKRFSFLWKENGTEIGRGSNIMLPISSAQHNISVEPVLGMDYVKYMCVPDGVDDYVYIQEGTDFVPSGDNTFKAIVDFVCGASTSSCGLRVSNTFCFVIATDCCAIYNGTNFDILRYPKACVSGNRYNIEVEYKLRSIISIKINGILISPIKNYGEYASISSSIGWIIGVGSRWKVINLKLHNATNAMIHSWDFQGATPADRLKDKVGTMHLTANNISDLNQFFQPL